jgi:hypothetical protein
LYVRLPLWSALSAPIVRGLYTKCRFVFIRNSSLIYFSFPIKILHTISLSPYVIHVPA